MPLNLKWYSNVSAVSAALALSVTLAAPAGAAPISAVTSRYSNAASHYDAGLKALGRSDLGEAQKDFELALTESGSEVKSLLALAEISRRLTDRPKAEAYLKRALKLAPDDIEVMISWATWLNGEARYGEARSVLEQATRLDTSAATPWVNLGVLYARTPDGKGAAIDAFHEALKRDPGLAGAHFALGSLLVQAGQVEQATAELIEAARLAPADARPWDLLGRIYSASGREKEAMTAYGRALDVEPKYISARLAIGDLYVRSGKVDKAAEAFASAAEINPKADAAWLRLGLLEETRGRTENAVRAYRRAINANPQQAIALNNLAAILNTHEGDRAEALQLSQQAVKISPNTAFLGTLSSVYNAQGDTKNALSTARKAVEARKTSMPMSGSKTSVP